MTMTEAGTLGLYSVVWKYMYARVCIYGSLSDFVETRGQSV